MTILKMKKMKQVICVKGIYILNQMRAGNYLAWAHNFCIGVDVL